MTKREWKGTLPFKTRHYAEALESRDEQGELHIRYFNVCGSKATSHRCYKPERTTCEACRTLIRGRSPTVRFSYKPCLGEEYKSTVEPLVDIRMGMSLEHYLQAFRDLEFVRVKQWLTRKGVRWDLPTAYARPGELEKSERAILLHSSIKPSPTNVTPAFSLKPHKHR